MPWQYCKADCPTPGAPVSFACGPNAEGVPRAVWKWHTGGATTRMRLLLTAGETRTVRAAGHSIQTDAEIAVVSVKADGPTAFVLRGSTVKLDGRDVPAQGGEWQVGPEQ